MLLFVIVHAASATSMTRCTVTPVDRECRPTPTATDLDVMRLVSSCETHSSAPGGPVSVSPAGPLRGPVQLLLDGVAVSEPVSPTARCGEGTFEIDAPLVAGLTYEVRWGDDGGRVRVGPDISPLSRCYTNPDTCVAAAELVPQDLAPWMRLHACVAGQPCAQAREDPLDDWGRTQLALGCASWKPEPCAWMAEIAPGEGWPLAALQRRGEGPVARKLERLQTSPLYGDVALRWSGTQPLVLPAGDPLPPADRAADGSVAATWSAEGLEVHDARGKLLWRWVGEGVQEVVVRPDGRQILVRFPVMFVRVPLDGSSDAVGTIYDERLLKGARAEGTLVRPDGWPAVAARISRCAPGAPEEGCVARTDLLGRFSLPVPPGEVVTARLDGPSVGPVPVEVEIRGGAQIPIPER